MTSFLTLNDILKQHFGVEVPIYSGGGRSLEDPYLLMPDETPQSKDYSSIEYLVVNCLCKLQKYEWKLIQQRLLNQNGRKIDSMEIEVKYLDEEHGSFRKENQTYYFDITECLKQPKTKSTTQEEVKKNDEYNPQKEHESRSNNYETTNSKSQSIISFKSKVIKISLVVVLLMGLFPPWNYIYRGGTIYAEKPASYSFIFSPPAPERDERPYGVKLDISRLILQWFLVIFVSGSIVYLRAEKNK